MGTALMALKREREREKDKEILPDSFCQLRWAACDLLKKLFTQQICSWYDPFTKVFSPRGFKNTSDSTVRRTWMSELGNQRVSSQAFLASNRALCIQTCAFCAFFLQKTKNPSPFQPVKPKNIPQAFDLRPYRLQWVTWADQTCEVVWWRN